MEEKINSILSELFKVDSAQLTDSATMDDIDLWDSLKHMELIVELENGFGISLEYDDIVKMQNIGSIKEVVKAKASVS